MARNLNGFISVVLMAVFCAAGTGSNLYADDGVVIRHLANEQNIIEVTSEGKYLILPIQDNAPEARIYVISGNERMSSLPANVRLARERIDYYIPFDISGHGDSAIKIDVQGMPSMSLCWKHISVSDTFDTANSEEWRPVLHHTPLYGWMNDPNGMFFKDGEYHLYYQYNPYGSTWGNMSWGHSVSKDLLHWESKPVALVPDAWGMIFSGSCVVDHNNTAGFGKDAVVAIYTSAKPTQWGDAQSQSLAYSTDGGYTFTKYEGNPVLVSEARDFRDPKVFWYEPDGHWVMLLALGQEMQIYSSPDLKKWKKESSFGLRQGAHGGVWECPDLIELPVEGTDLKKWVLLCNINPGGPFGGSATQYFVGSFDGRKFTNEFPTETKWMDWGKDNYATVTWSNVEDRTVAVGWMSNWQYQVDLPFTQFRGANTLPRELSLYKDDEDIFLKAVPVRELEQARTLVYHSGQFQVSDEDVRADDFMGKGVHSSSSRSDMDGAYEICLSLRTGRTGRIGFSLMNDKDEKVDFWILPERGQFVMDRTESGKTDFNINFPAVTVAQCPMENNIDLRIVVDRSSVEVFGDGGRFVMTNIVFPTEPYTSLCFYGTYSNYTVKSVDIYDIR